jgi:UDP-N-acetylglucosamine 2-epimerase (non-hydrolysing)
MNREITSRIADIHFAPTEQAAQNLIREAIDPNSIVITGNTVIDALYHSIARVNAPDYIHAEIEQLKQIIPQGSDFILVTGHRRENFGEGFIHICQALKEIAQKRPDVQIIYPVHLNPNVQKPVYDQLGGISNIHLINPLSYPSFVWAMDKSKLIITDSGGVQEEAPSLGKPVLVMRDTTERPEAVEAGTVILVGTDRQKIASEALDLLSNQTRYDQMSHIANPYGDGKACERIVETLKK